MRYYEGFFLILVNHFIPIHGIVGGYEAEKHRNAFYRAFEKSKVLNGKGANYRL